MFCRRLMVKSFWLSLICFIACIPSGSALLAKVYGLASMQVITLAVALPCCAGLVGVWVLGRRLGKEQLASALAIGFLGGLLGTIAYDVSRLPFYWIGYLVYTPISIYGVWIAGTGISSQYTEMIGWAYHFSNGITFGIMYAIFMREHHWAWAILWAFVLETIAVLSPFARIFALSGNYGAIANAYLGHVAYGLPLGWLVFKWDDTRHWLTKLSIRLKWSIVALVCTIILWRVVLPESVERDRRAVRGEFRVEGHRLNPDIFQIERGGNVYVYNPSLEAVLVIVKQSDIVSRIGSGQKEPLFFPKTGIYQIFVQTERRTRSSFVIVEPVEELE